MKRIGLAFFLGSTALVGLSEPALADPVSILVAGLATAAGGIATAVIGGTAIVWSAILGQAAVAGVLAGIQSAFAPDAPPGPEAQNLTLNRITPVTTGLILYGERMLGGSIIARSTTRDGSAENGRYHSIIPIACHEIDGVVEGYIGETLVWTEAQYLIDEAAGSGNPLHWGHVAGDFRGRFIFQFHLGSDDQVAEPRYVAAADEWGVNARGRGISYVYFEADFNRNVFPQGVEQIRIRARGKRVFDPRDGQTRWSANPALCLRDYVLTPELRGGIGWAGQDVDAAAIIALANLSDEQIPLAGGGTEARYEFNGVLDTASAPEENLNRFSTSWAGWWTVDRGQITVGGGAYEAPTFEITEDIMTGAISVQARRPFEDQFNVVKAIYADPENEFVPSDLPVLSSNTFRAVDNGEELIKDLGELPGETGFARGQRLTKLALLKGRRQRLATIPCSLAAWNVRLGENVLVTVPRRGWIAKPFEVVDRAVSVSAEGVGVRFSLLENGPDVYSYLTSEETPKPVGGVPSLASPTAPPIISAPTFTEELYVTRGGGGVKTRVALASMSDNPFIESWQFSWRLAVDTDENIGSLSDTPDTLLEDMAPGFYVFGVRAINLRGVKSEWTYAGEVEVQGLNAEPVGLSGLSISVVSGLATLRWNAHPEIDVLQGGTIEVRHSSDPLATWQTSTSIGKAVPGAATIVTLPAISGVYLLRPIDSTGAQGPISTIMTDAPDFQSLTLIDTVEPGPVWAGAKVGCEVISGNLALSTGQVLGDYEIAGEIDLGAVQTVRITSLLQAQISERSDLFDSGELFDSPALFEGDGNADGDIEVLYRVSLVAPGAYGPWLAFDRTDVTARLLQFKMVLAAESDEILTQASGLIINIETSS